MWSNEEWFPRWSSMPFPFRARVYLYTPKLTHLSLLSSSDAILSVLWILLSLTGIVLQLYDARDRTRAPFPGSSTGLVGYDTISRDPDVTTKKKSRRWNPIRTGANQKRLLTDSTANDEKSSLLLTNFNNHDPQPVTPPSDYITNANRTDYQNID